jgi:galactitol-specific phosphotransferase system IIB component
VPETRVITSSNNVFVAANVAIYEGQYIADTYVMDYSTPNQRFVLSSETVDTDSISVSVLEDSGSTTLQYTTATSLFGLVSTSQVCFVQAAENEKYEILFGDGLIGRKPKNASTIVVSYRVSSGELGNGASTFAPDTKIDGHADVEVTVLQTASGGSVGEDNESIRFNAPRFFQTQERAITTTDYKTLLFARFPEITAVNVYGGETASPPRYGKVLVSIDVRDADGVPEFKKNEYLQYIRERCSLSIDPVFIDPSFLYLDVTVNVRYNALATVLSQQDIESRVKYQVIQYSSNNLDDYDVIARSSNISKSIDAADQSILSNDLIINPYILIVPTTGVSYRSEIAFGNKLRQRTATNIPSLISEQALYSSLFTYQGTTGASLLDDGNGVIRVVQVTPTNIYTLKDNVGTVDYATGKINITNLLVQAYEGLGIQIFVNLYSGDVVATNNLIMKIDPADIHITVTPERI